MNDEIIDAHVHLRPNREEERASSAVPGRRDRDRWGSAESIIPYLDWEGISFVVAVHFIRTPVVRRELLAAIAPDVSGAQRRQAEQAVEEELRRRVQDLNTWLCSVPTEQPRIVPAVTVHGIFSPPGMVDEVARGIEAGAKAVKMLPGWYREFPNERAFWPLYDLCQEQSIPLLFDTGTLGMGQFVGYPDEVNTVCYGQPRWFEDVLRDFPNLTLVMAHFGSAFWDERVELALRYPNVVFDISGGFDAPGIGVRDGHRALHEADAARVMRRVGMDRFMFGSDGPHHMVQPYIEQTLRLGLSDEGLELLLAGNARRVYSIPPVESVV